MFTADPAPESDDIAASSAGSMSHHTRDNLAAVKRISERLASERTRADLIIDTLTAFGGSKAFIVIHVIWYGGWILINVFGPPALRFDPFPFAFLTLAVSLEAIFLSTFILITQNRQARLADMRENLDLQINMLSEQENTKMLRMLEAIHRKLCISDEADPELPELEQEVEAEMLAQQIEHDLDHKPDSAKR